MESLDSKVQEEGKDLNEMLGNPANLIDTEDAVAALQRQFEALQYILALPGTPPTHTMALCTVDSMEITLQEISNRVGDIEGALVRTKIRS